MKLKQEAARTTEELAAEFGQLVEDGRALLAEAMGQSPSRIQQFRDAFADVSEKLAGFQTSATRAAKRGATYARQADDYVHDNPWPAVAAGLALGGLATLWWSQRR